MPSNTIPLRLTDAEKDIVQGRIERLGITKADYFRSLIWFDGMVQGDHPLTGKIRALPPEKRHHLIENIAEAVQHGEPAKPEAFSEWVKEAAAEAAEAVKDCTADRIIDKLLKS